MGDYLFDYDQEYVLKTDLDLDLTGAQLSRDFRVQVVNGVAGSGKTLVLLFRLKLLKFFFPKKAFSRVDPQSGAYSRNACPL